MEALTEQMVVLMDKMDRKVDLCLQTSQDIAQTAERRVRGVEASVARLEGLVASAIRLQPGPAAAPEVPRQESLGSQGELTRELPSFGSAAPRHRSPGLAGATDWAGLDQGEPAHAIPPKPSPRNATSPRPSPRNITPMLRVVRRPSAEASAAGDRADAAAPAAPAAGDGAAAAPEPRRSAAGRAISDSVVLAARAAAPPRVPAIAPPPRSPPRATTPQPTASAKLVPVPSPRLQAFVPVHGAATKQVLDPSLRSERPSLVPRPPGGAGTPRGRGAPAPPYDAPRARLPRNAEPPPARAASTSASASAFQAPSRVPLRTSPSPGAARVVARAAPHRSPALRSPAHPAHASPPRVKSLSPNPDPPRAESPPPPLRDPRHVGRDGADGVNPPGAPGRRWRRGCRCVRCAVVRVSGRRLSTWPVPRPWGSVVWCAGAGPLARMPPVPPRRPLCDRRGAASRPVLPQGREVRRAPTTTSDVGHVTQGPKGGPDHRGSPIGGPIEMMSERGHSSTFMMQQPQQFGLHKNI